MKISKYTYLVILIFFCINVTGQNSFMSYNIRYDNPNDNENWWEHRKQEIVQMIHYYHPDILGIQEGLHKQVDFLDQSLRDYSYVGIGREDGKKKEEYTAIFYNTKRFELIESKTYWLSETPNDISIGWDASMERITTYGTFKNRSTKDTIHVFNCHFDHVGKIAQQKSTTLLLHLIQQNNLDKKTIILMGDLNCEPKETPIQNLKTELEDAFEVTHIPAYGPIGTFNQFDSKQIPEKRIDYIFTKNAIVQKYRNIDDRRKNNLWLSDHLPVLIEIKSSIDSKK